MKSILSAGALAAAVAVTGFATTIPTIDTAHAQATSLAGQKGKVKRRLPNGHGDCAKAVREYIAASGHSAYAQTAWNYSIDRGGICSSALNRKSKAEAEAMALAGCEQGTKKWKYAYSGKCVIAASK